MHASLVTNYQQQPLHQAQQQLHDQQQQHHYYGYQTGSINVTPRDGACSVVGLQRSINVQTDLVDKSERDGESNEASGRSGNELPLSSATAASNQEVVLEEDNDQQHHQQPETGQEGAVNFLDSLTSNGQMTSAYDAGRELNPQEHYRYNTAATIATSYQPHEEEYYEHQQPTEQPLVEGFIPSHEEQATFHHDHHQQPELVALSSSRQQAVDLTNPDQLHQQQHQHSHGPFEPAQTIYYDLSSASVADHTNAASSTALDYQEHHHHHHHTQHQHQHQQHNHHHQLMDPHRVPTIFYQQSLSQYQSGSSAIESRHPAEFVSVLTEQNRFLQQGECHDGLAATELATNIACHQYPYEQPSSRLVNNIQLDQSSSTSIYTNNSFHPNKIQAHHHQPPQTSSSPVNELDVSSHYCQSLNLIAADYQHHQNQGLCTTSDHHRANNENYHHNAHEHLQEPIDNRHEQHIVAQIEKQHHPSELRQQQQHQEVDHDEHELMGIPSGSLGPRDTHSCALSTISESSSSMTINSDLESVDSALTRDEKKAREANIPLSYHEIVNLSIEQFNDHISRFPYTEGQLTLMKDIRRRGKNKVAAQTCRKRKMEQIIELQQEVGELANKRMMLALERSRLSQEHAKLAKEYDRWCQVIQNHLQSDQSHQGHVSGNNHEPSANTNTSDQTLQGKLWSSAKSQDESTQQQVSLC